MIGSQLYRRIPLVRGPYLERDRALRERDFVALKLANFVETSNAEVPATPFAKTSASRTVGDAFEAVLTKRIIAAYLASIKTRPSAEGSFWDSTIFDMRRDIHEALISENASAVQGVLCDPGKTDLCYGFDIPARSNPPLAPDEEYAFPSIRICLS
jgi:hypothetical protein